MNVYRSQSQRQSNEILECATFVLDRQCIKTFFLSYFWPLLPLLRERQEMWGKDLQQMSMGWTGTMTAVLVTKPRLYGSPTQPV